MPDVPKYDCIQIFKSGVLATSTAAELGNKSENTSAILLTLLWDDNPHIRIVDTLEVGSYLSLT